MYKRVVLVLSLLICQLASSYAQKLILAGPMQGYIEYRTAKIWVEVAPDVTALSIRYYMGNQQPKTMKYKGSLNNVFNPVVFDLYELEPGTTYQYEISAQIGKKAETKKGSFRTQDLWMYRTPAPDFSFLTGSCSYFNDTVYAPKGEPYGGDSSIFITMSKMKADFMLWLGDNWYTRDVDYHSKWGLWNRAHLARTQPVLQPLLSAMPQYAIWDDHDYGPNNFGASYILRQESRRVFTNYWANPSYGMDGQGVYTQFAFSDAVFFLLDDRSWRSSDYMMDSIKGKPNSEKRMLGDEQMRWLKSALLQSKDATFKLIANGSQILNTYSRFDCLYHFPIEYQELLSFIADNDIEGVIFLTGDRHRSEIVKHERAGKYTLYDVTTSPLTSKLYNAGGVETNMPTKVVRVEGKHNFSRITVSGATKERKLSITYYDRDGVALESWSIMEQELKNN